jgi:hypothetical protein
VQQICRVASDLRSSALWRPTAPGNSQSCAPGGSTECGAAARDAGVRVVERARPRAPLRSMAPLPGAPQPRDHRRAGEPQAARPPPGRRAAPPPPRRPAPDAPLHVRRWGAGPAGHPSGKRNRGALPDAAEIESERESEVTQP